MVETKQNVCYQQIWHSAGYQTGFPSNFSFPRSRLWSCSCSRRRLRELLAFGADSDFCVFVCFLRLLKDGLLLKRLLIFAIMTACVKCIFCWPSCDLGRDLSKKNGCKGLRGTLWSESDLCLRFSGLTCSLFTDVLSLRHGHILHCLSLSS